MKDKAWATHSIEYTQQKKNNIQDLGVVFFPAFDWAITPTHPEREERLLYTQDQLAEEGIFDLQGITEYRPQVAEYTDIERVHFCLPSVENVCTASHLVAAGGALRTARLIMEGEAKRAFALVRPPGHHAMRITHGNRGFCNVNMEAVMVEYIRQHYTPKDFITTKGLHRTAKNAIHDDIFRIAVVDTDCHHGDGSQDIFWNDPHTLFISLHQDGRTLYPGTGFLQEYGGPGALGKTINIPLPPTTGDAGYLYALENAVLPILEDFKPHIIINSAGQDNHFTDPLANMRLTARGYAELTKRLAPDIAVLEGGYAVRGALPYVNLAICLALAERPFEDICEPQWTEQLLQQDKKVSEHIKHVSQAAIKLYHTAPAMPHEGQEKNGWWTRHRNIYYDTDNLCDEQYEAIKLCPHCPGILRTESQSRRVPKSLCVYVPRTACEHCCAFAQDIVFTARKQKTYTHIRLLDPARLTDMANI